MTMDHGLTRRGGCKTHLQRTFNLSFDPSTNELISSIYLSSLTSTVNAIPKVMYLYGLNTK